MTDVDFVRGLAESVMGWTYSLGELPANRKLSIFRPLGRTEAIEVWTWGKRSKGWQSEKWNPLTSDADAFMLVDALEAKGYWFQLTSLVSHHWAAQFNGHPDYHASDPDRRCAICLAAWRTVEGAKR